MSKFTAYLQERDLPTVIYPDGTQCWYSNDKLHRDDDKPAVIYPDGTQKWYKNDKLHRDHDKPAVILSNGTQKWYKNGIWIRSAFTAYLQDSDGYETDLSVVSTEPPDGTYCIDIPSLSTNTKQFWVRIPNIKDLFCDMIRNLPMEPEDSSIFDEMSDFINDERYKRSK